MAISLGIYPTFSDKPILAIMLIAAPAQPLGAESGALQMASRKLGVRARSTCKIMNIYLYMWIAWILKQFGWNTLASLVIIRRVRHGTRSDRFTQWLAVMSTSSFLTFAPWPISVQDRRCWIPWLIKFERIGTADCCYPSHVHPNQSLVTDTILQPFNHQRSSLNSEACGEACGEAAHMEASRSAKPRIQRSRQQIQQAVQFGCSVLSTCLECFGVQLKLILFNGISIFSRKQCPCRFELVCIALALLVIDHFDFAMRCFAGLCSPASTGTSMYKQLEHSSS